VLFFSPVLKGAPIIMNKLPEEERQQLNAIYKELKELIIESRSIARLERLFNSAMEIAERNQGRASMLKQDLINTSQSQLTRVKAMDEMDSKKIMAITELRLFLMGDLIGWF
jgi:phosphoribosylpyrophosphate synthetase